MTERSEFEAALVDAIARVRCDSSAHVDMTPLLDAYAAQLDAATALRATNQQLNRRCQEAESALAKLQRKIDTTPVTRLRENKPLVEEVTALRAELDEAGRHEDVAVTKWHAAEAELAAARAELARRDELAAGHPGMCCGVCVEKITRAEAEVAVLRAERSNLATRELVEAISAERDKAISEHGALKALLDGACLCEFCSAKYEALGGESHRKREIANIQEQLATLQGLMADRTALKAERDDALDMLGTRDRFNDDANEALRAERDAAVRHLQQYKSEGAAACDSLRAEVATLKAALDDMVNDMNRPHAALLRDVASLRAEVAALKAELAEEQAARKSSAVWNDALSARADDLMAERDVAHYAADKMREAAGSLMAQRDVLVRERDALRAALMDAERWAHVVAVPIGTGLGGGVASMTPQAAAFGQVTHWNECPGCLARAALAGEGQP